MKRSDLIDAVETKNTQKVIACLAEFDTATFNFFTKWQTIKSQAYHIAITYPDTEIAQVLKNAGAQLSKKVFLEKVNQGEIAAVKAAIDLDSQLLTVMDHNGNTPFLLACKNHHYELMVLFQGYGQCNLAAVNFQYKNAFRLLAEHCMPKGRTCAELKAAVHSLAEKILSDYRDVRLGLMLRTPNLCTNTMQTAVMQNHQSMVIALMSLQNVLSSLEYHRLLSETVPCPTHPNCHASPFLLAVKQDNIQLAHLFMHHMCRPYSFKGKPLSTFATQKTLKDMLMQYEKYMRMPTTHTTEVLPKREDCLLIEKNQLALDF